MTPICEVCGKVLTPKVAEYSKGKLGRYLCTTHQKAPTTKVEPAEVDATLSATDDQRDQLYQLIKDGKLDKKYEPKIATVSYANAVKILERFNTQGEGTII